MVFLLRCAAKKKRNHRRGFAILVAGLPAGGDKGIRTPGLCIANAALYQLSHIPTVAEKVGFEPTCRLPDKRISSAPRYDHFDTSP